LKFYQIFLYPLKTRNTVNANLDRNMVELFYNSCEDVLFVQRVAQKNVPIQSPLTFRVLTLKLILSGEIFYNIYLLIKTGMMRVMFG